MDDEIRPPPADPTLSGENPAPDRSATARERVLEDIVAEFILRREDGESPAIEEYLARYPRYAEDLAFLLSDELGATPPLTLPEPDGETEDQTAPVRPPAPLRRVGPYEILEPVAQGGGGTVFRARHHEDHHIVALKVLDRFGVGDPRDLERFQREAKMLRSMDLVSIVPVYAVGEDEGRLWIAMKWIEGQTLVGLKEAVKSPAHPLHDFRERARLLARVARTFGAVHGYGILHRDVKPSNIMVDRLFEPVIIDFGIARAPDLSELTQTLDGPMGTPRYLAPELVSGGTAAISPQVDIYGLGLCVFELVTGVQAFFQKSRTDLFTQIQKTGPPDPRTLNPAIPFAFAAIILRAIEINPKRRYATMNDFAADLERFARGEVPDPMTLRRAHPARRFLLRHGRRAVAASALAVALLGLVLWGIGWMTCEARIRKLDAEITPWLFAPPEVLPADHRHLAAAAMEVRDLAPDRPEICLHAAWIQFQAGDFSAALQLLGDQEPGEPPSAGLFRDYLSLLVHRADLGVNERLVTVSTAPSRVNPEGKGFGDRFDTEVMESREFSEEEEARRRLLTPPARNQIERILTAGPRSGDQGAVHALRAVILWQSLPSGLKLDEAAKFIAEFEAEIEAALVERPGLLWPRFLRAGERLRYAQPAEARADLEVLAGALPDVPGVAHLRAVAHARPFSRDGDPDLASREFARAASGYVSQGLPAAEGVLRKEPLRKIYGAWALHEVERGRAGEAERVLAQWESAFSEPTWQDRVFPLILRARLEVGAGQPEAAIELLRRARGLNPKFALPLREEERILRVVLQDEDQAERLAVRAASAPMHAPASIESWIKGNFFGLRPYCLKLSYAFHVERLEQGREVVPAEGR